MKLSIIPLIVAVLLTGCATTAKYETTLQSWIGHDIDELVDTWGYPSSSFVAPNGNLVYVYKNSGTYTMPAQMTTTYNTFGNTTYANSQLSGGQTLHLWCNTFFETNSARVIIRWKWEGNRCSSR